MHYALKKTNELSAHDIQEITELHYRVFKRALPEEEFKRKFNGSCTGYSYHGLMYKDGCLVGNYAAIPYRYTYFEKEYVFALAVDGMVDAEHRDFLSYRKIAYLVYAALAADNIPFIYCFPNENAYVYTLKILQWQAIGRLPYYLLPLRLGAWNSLLKIFDNLSYGSASFFNRTLAFFFNSRDSSSRGTAAISKVLDSDFIEQRYDKSYCRVEEGKSSFVYKKWLEDGIRVAYLIDIFPLQRMVFYRAVRYILEKEKREVDVIMYLGNVPFWVGSLIKMPRNFEPKKFCLTGKILKEGMVDKRIFDIRNWQINLSNFDVR